MGTTALAQTRRWVVMGLAALMVAGSHVTAIARPIDDRAASMAVVLVLDNSGSYTVPGRESFAAFANAAGQQAEIAVVVFDTTARVALPLGDISTPERRAAFDSTVTSVDGRAQNTVLNAGLETALGLLSGVDSAKSDRHIVFFSDGVSDPPRHLNRDSLSRDWERLVSICATAGIRVSAVCPPGKADLQGMEALASATRGLCIVARDPAKAVSAVLRFASGEHSRPAAATAPLTNAVGRKWRDFVFLAVLLVITAGAVALILVRRRAARRRMLGPGGQKEKEGLAGIAEAVAQLRTLAAHLGEPGSRIGELASVVEAAGCAAFTEQRGAGARMRKFLGEIISTRDEVEDLLKGIGADDHRGRENLEFVDELLARALASGKVKETVVPVGSLYDCSLHEPRPEQNSAPRGTILRVERKGYVIQQGASPAKVLRFAKVVVSDG